MGVVGHGGFVGRAVMAALERRGLAARAIEVGRVDVAPSDDPAGAVEQWRGSSDWECLVDQLRAVEVVVNAAGRADPDGTDERALWSANVALPAIVAAACADAGVARMVHVSSAAVQGPGPLDESERQGPFSPYSSSKAAAERHLLSLVAGGIPPAVVVYRPTSVMGPKRETTRRLRRRCAGRVPAVSASTPLPLAHVGNVGDAAAFLATVERPPTIATHPWEGVTVADVVGWCGGRIQPVPASLARAGEAGLAAVARASPSLSGAAARARLFLHGQEIDAQALAGRGWSPPVPKEAYVDLFREPAASGPLRIAFLITRSDTVGGAHVHVRDLARSLLDLGHDVHVLIGADGPYGEILRSRHIPVVSVPSLVRHYDVRADRRAYAELKAILADVQPEILSTHSSKAGILGRLAGRRLGIPTLFTAHGWAFTSGVGRKEQALYSAVEVAAAPLASRIVCVSEHDRRLAHRLGIDRLAPTDWVPNAVRDVPAELRAAAGIEPPRLIMVARLDGQKCQDEVLAALGKLAQRPFHVDFVGDGPRQAELEGLADELGIASRCRFLGRRDDVEACLAGAQIFVLMSNYEGMPRSILEAMRAGLPVVASRTAGVPEVVVDGETGLLVEPHDVDGLVRALEALFDDPALRAAMGRAGRRRYEARYELGRLVDDMLELYGEVVGRPLGPGQPSTP